MVSKNEMGGLQRRVVEANLAADTWAHALQRAKADAERLEMEAQDLKQRLGELTGRRYVDGREPKELAAVRVKLGETWVELEMAQVAIAYLQSQAEAEAKEASVRRRHDALTRASGLQTELRARRLASVGDEMLQLASYSLGKAISDAALAEPPLLTPVEAGSFTESLPSRERPGPRARLPFPPGPAPWAPLVEVIAGLITGPEADRVLAEWTADPILRALGVGAEETAEA